MSAPVAATIARLHAATAELDAPVAALDVATLRANAAALRERAGNTPIRVASKSVRCRAVLAEVLGPELTAHNGFAGIMAYSLAEAIWLARQGARDILLGYPVTDRSSVAELATDPLLVSAITFMVDGVDQLEFLRTALGTDRVRPQVCLDIDAALRIGPIHLGVRRSPVRTPDQAAELAEQAQRRGFIVVGLMTYEAQIAGLPDRNVAIRWVKRASAVEITRRRRAVVDAVRAVAGPLRIVNSGGTGSLEVSTSDSVVTEVTAGSGLYMPTLFDDYRAFTAHPALFFALAVQRIPASGTVTVFGGGYIASGPTGKSRAPTPVWPPGLRLLGAEGAGEVQTPLSHAATPDRPGSGPTLGVGDRVWFRHAKAGELCERFTQIQLVDSEGQRTAVPTYRGEGQCFG